MEKLLEKTMIVPKYGEKYYSKLHKMHFEIYDVIPGASDLLYTLRFLTKPCRYSYNISKKKFNKYYDAGSIIKYHYKDTELWNKLEGLE